MSSPSDLLTLPYACPLQRPYPPLYEVCFTSDVALVISKAFHIVWYMYFNFCTAPYGCCFPLCTFISSFLYADDSTVHYSTSFNRRPSLQELNASKRDATERLTSNLSAISNWGRANLVKFNASKLNFFTYPLGIIFQKTILSSSVTFNCLPPPH